MNSISLWNFWVPVYLDQQVVFDLLAIMEDGFSHLSSIRTSELISEDKRSGFRLGLNVFTVKLEGKKDKGNKTESSQEVLQEKVHTPTSLFSKLYSLLSDRGLIKQIGGESDLDNVNMGDFVSFKATVRKWQLVDFFEQLIHLTKIFGPFTGKKHKQKVSQELESIKLFESLLNAFKSSNTVILLAEIENGIKGVISAKLGNFRDQSLMDIIGGEYLIFGKAVRVIRSPNEAIDLLDKTSFSIFDENFRKNVFNRLKEVFTQSENVGFNPVETEYRITGPAVEIIPIAIYI